MLSHCHFSSYFDLSNCTVLPSGKKGAVTAQRVSHATLDFFTAGAFYITHGEKSISDASFFFLWGVSCVSLPFISALVVWNAWLFEPPHFTQSDIRCNHTTLWVLPIVYLISRLDTVDYICLTWKRNVTCFNANVPLNQPSHWEWSKHITLFFPQAQTYTYFIQIKLLGIGFVTLLQSPASHSSPEILECSFRLFSVQKDWWMALQSWSKHWVLADWLSMFMIHPR